MSYFLLALSKFAQFSGRSRRSEYWYFFLFYFCISIALTLLDALLGFSTEDGAFGVLSGIFALGMLIPSLAVGVRRLHDTGRTGWWMLVAFIPIIGFIVYLYFCCQDSTPGDNQYGPNPKPLTFFPV